MRDKNSNNIHQDAITDAVKIYMNLKLSGNTPYRTIKKLIQKPSKCFKKEIMIQFVLHYETTKLNYLQTQKRKHHSLAIH